MKFDEKSLVSKIIMSKKNIALICDNNRFYQLFFFKSQIKSLIFKNKIIKTEMIRLYSLSLLCRTPPECKEKVLFSVQKIKVKNAILGHVNEFVSSVVRRALAVC